mmetsp:Transcript_10983/g.27687  ORF Transcript_10983/g.27687 Transcript_10983/m.27687 type:complete len:192 (+) Transcript_10983:679-1254(+)
MYTIEVIALSCVGHRGATTKTVLKAADRDSRASAPSDYLGSFESDLRNSSSGMGPTPRSKATIAALEQRLNQLETENEQLRGSLIGAPPPEHIGIEAMRAPREGVDSSEPTPRIVNRFSIVDGDGEVDDGYTSSDSSQDEEDFCPSLDPKAAPEVPMPPGLAVPAPEQPKPAAKVSIPKIPLDTLAAGDGK